MKTRIIPLESHDDLISVRDRLNWAKTPRILLVWPKYEQVSLRLLDLKVLQRQAGSLGAQLGLVTRRTNVRRDAESLGIPVFDSTTSAQKDQWPAPIQRQARARRSPRQDLRKLREAVYEKEPAWRISLLGRVVAFSAGVLGVLALVGVLFPRATITLYPESRTQSMIIPITAGESFSSVSPSGDLPSRSISVVVEARQSRAIINEILVPNSKSQGIARFQNQSRGEVDIPQGTVISTGTGVPVRFSTLHPTLLPPGEDEFVDVPIEAMLAGSAGNVPADSIGLVEGPLASLVTVTNPKLIAGGTDEKLVGASDDDRADLREAMLENLMREARSNLMAQISAEDIFLPDTLEIRDILEETYNPAAGQPGKSLELTLRVEYSARYISREDLDQFTQMIMNASEDADYVPSGPPRAEPQTEPRTDSAGMTRFNLEVSRQLLHEVDTMSVFLKVRGGEPNILRKELLSEYPLRAEPEIRLFPSWWPWIPLIPFNITVEMK